MAFWSNIWRKGDNLAVNSGQKLQPESSEEWPDGTSKEKVKTIFPMPVILPWLDPLQTADETAATRIAYRQMLRSPIVMAGFLKPILSASTLRFESHPFKADAGQDPSDRDKQIARFVRWMLMDRLEGGLPEFAFNVLAHARMDGVSVNEKVWGIQEDGQYKNKEVLRQLKPKDVDQDLYLWTDAYRNVTAVQGLRYNSGEFWDPRSFIILQNLSFFGNPGGMSALRPCYDDKTEVLTKNGWKFFADLSPEDEIASLDRDDGSLVYSKPTDIIHYHYQGEMFRQNSTHVDLCVTPNHQMWVAKRNGGNGHGDFEFVEAAKLMDGSYPKIFHYKRNADWKGEERKTFTLPAIEWRQQICNAQGSYGEHVRKIESKILDMDDWLRFLGIYLAEGWSHRRKDGNKQAKVCIAQNPGEILDEIKSLLTRLGFDYTADRKPGKSCTLTISNLQLWTYTHRLGNSHTKFIPAEFKGLSRRQLNILFQWMMKGDGRGDRNYCTVSKKLADDVSEIILKCGFAPHLKREKTYTGGIWIVAANIKGIGATEVNRIGDKRSWEMYDGTVHCVTVPQRIIYVRRNGKSCWCGNCYTDFWQLDTVEKIRAMGAEKRAFPVIAATYPSTDKESKLQAALNTLRYSNWLAVPKDVQFHILNTAGSADEYFQSFRRDKIENIFIGLEFAFLQSITGGQHEYRGSAEVAKGVSSLMVFWLAQRLIKVFNSEENGLIKEIVDRNYRNVDGYPKATLTQVDLEAMTKMAALINTLQQCGFKVGIRWAEETFGIPFSRDASDVLERLDPNPHMERGGPKDQGARGKESDPGKLADENRMSA